MPTALLRVRSCVFDVRPQKSSCRSCMIFAVRTRAEQSRDRRDNVMYRSVAQASKPAPPTPIDEKKVELGGTPWNPQWDQIIEKALPPEMLSSQVPPGVRRFCPRFYEMAETDKRAFWAYFFQALAGAEAGLNPNTSGRHIEPTVAKHDEVRGTPTRSE